MNEYLISVILGIVEGLTEFLPISSTAHLRIAEALIGISLKDPYWKMYSIVIQLGAIISVVVYFRKRLIDFIKTFPNGKNNEHSFLTHPLTLIMVAFLCTAGPMFILKKKGIIGDNLEKLWIMGTSLMVGGVIMWAVDVLFTRPRTLNIDRMSFVQAIWIGICQNFSGVFPGTSRSMSTIAAGQVAGMSRESALEFSFYLSVPTMFAATGVSLLDAIKGKEGAAELHLTMHQWSVLGVGFVVSFVVALACIAWFLHWVRKHGFVPFAIYRLVLGLAILVMLRVGYLAD